MSSVPSSAGISGHYIVECYRGAELRWREEFDNLVTTVGMNKILDACFVTGLTAPAWYIGIKDQGTPVAADTMGSHASWPTITPYSNGTDPAFTPAAPASAAITNSASKAVFTINTSDELFGIFVKDSATKGGAAGTLMSVGDFGTSQQVQNGETINVTVSYSLVSL